MLFFILILSFFSISSATNTLYIHVGPHKTGSTHFQSVLTRLRSELTHQGVCWPSEDVKAFHELAIQVFQNDYINRTVEPMVGIDRCLQKYSKTIISSETFDIFDVNAIRRLKELFAAYKVEFRILIVYRDWFLRLYSAYGEISRAAKYSTLTTLQGFLNSVFEPAVRKLESEYISILQRYEEVFGRGALTIVDYAGVHDAGKDVAQVLLCEAMQISCGNYSRVFHRRENVATEVRSYEVLVLLRNIAWARGCVVNPIYDAMSAIVDIIKEYESYIDFLPTYQSQLQPWKELSVKRRKEFDDIYYNQTLYSSASSSMASLMNLSVQFVDYDALYAESTLLDKLKKEVVSLINRNVFVSCSEA